MIRHLWFELEGILSILCHAILYPVVFGGIRGTPLSKERWERVNVLDFSGTLREADPYF